MAGTWVLGSGLVVPCFTIRFGEWACMTLFGVLMAWAAGTILFGIHFGVLATDGDVLGESAGVALTDGDISMAFIMAIM